MRKRIHLPSIILKVADKREPSDGIGWVLSGFRSTAHFIVEDGDNLKAICGIRWMMSDAVTGGKPPQNTSRCRRCATMIAKEARNA